MIFNHMRKDEINKWYAKIIQDTKRGKYQIGWIKTLTQVLRVDGLCLKMLCDMHVRSKGQKRK